MMHIDTCWRWWSPRAALTEEVCHWVAPSTTCDGWLILLQTATGEPLECHSVQDMNSLPHTLPVFLSHYSHWTRFKVDHKDTFLSRAWWWVAVTSVWLSRLHNQINMANKVFYRRKSPFGWRRQFVSLLKRAVLVSYIREPTPSRDHIWESIPI